MSADDVTASDADVVVLGAGPAGLAAAWYAVRRGFSVVVLDRASTVGGLAGSIVVDGQRVDFGSHRLHPSIRPDLLADLRAMLGDGLQSRPRNGRIRLEGRWLAFPLTPGNLVRNAPLGFAAGALGDLVTAPRRARRGTSSDDFSSTARVGMGSTIADKFYGPYVRKLFGVEPDELSDELFRRRVGAQRSSAIVRRMFRRGPRQTFWYPAGGFGQICESIADSVTSLGGTVRLSTALERIAGDGDTVTVRCVGDVIIRSRTVISTIPARDFAAIAGAPPAVRQAAGQLEHRGALLVYLSVPTPRYTPFDAHYFPGPGVLASRLSEPKHYRVSANDPADHTVLCAEIPATVGDATWSTGDTDLAAKVRADLVASGLPDPAPTSIQVERKSHVYPVYRRGYETHRASVDRWIDGLDGVIAVGRQALFAHDNTHHALLMGQAAARSLDVLGRVDRAAWTSVRATFADHVVED